LDEESEVLMGIKARFGEALTEAEEKNGELHFTVAPEHLLALCEYLRDEPSLAFDYPADLTARDTGEQIILWYRLVSMRHNRTALLHVVLPLNDPMVDSVTPLWPGMNWHERECFDLFGVRFRGHPDDGDPARMRILLPEDWEGHPFRHDYEPVFSGNPLHGPQERN
jgi:NADH-quinone oxidoreductase subunit C